MSNKQDARRSASERGYNSRWRKARNTYLSQHPLCVLCETEGRTTAATVVDHIKPHKGDQTLFWDTDNWQALCGPHHNSHKQSIEKGGQGRYGCDADGRPRDPSHPWNK